MTQDQDLSPTAKKALISATTVAIATTSSYFMREHYLTLMIPPLVAIVLLYMPPKTPRGTLLRVMAVVLAMLAFNGSVLFGHGLAIPDSFPLEEMTPHFVALTKTIPTLITLFLNAAVIFSWRNRPPMTAPQAGSLAADSLSEAGQNKETHQEI